MIMQLNIVQILSKYVPYTVFWMQLNFFGYIYAFNCNFFDLGAKPGPPRCPEEGGTDEKIRPKCSMEKSLPPDRAIERTNGLQDCQNDAQWCPKSPQMCQNHIQKRQTYCFKTMIARITTASVSYTHLTLPTTPYV